MTSKALWDLRKSRLAAYPRYDDQPVVGLDNSRYITVSLVREPEPVYDSTKDFLVPTTIIDLDALTYTYGWTVEPLPPLPPPSPNYQDFYSALLASDCYRAVLAEVLATTSPAPAGALAVFVSSMQDCLSGRANPDAMQSAIWLLLSQLHLDTAHLVELQAMLANAHLDKVYLLTPPES